jgi:hypothetical protein
LDKIYIGVLRNPMIYKCQSEIKRNHFISMHNAIKLSDGELVINEKGNDGTWDLNWFQKLTKPKRDKKDLKRKVSMLNPTDNVINLKINSKNKIKKPTQSQI